MCAHVPPKKKKDFFCFVSNIFTFYKLDSRDSQPYAELLWRDVEGNCCDLWVIRDFYIIDINQLSHP